MGGGELVETDDISITPEMVEEYIPLTWDMAVLDQTGAEYSLGLTNVQDPTGPMFHANPRDTQNYQPGQPSIAFRA